MVTRPATPPGAAARGVAAASWGDRDGQRRGWVSWRWEGDGGATAVAVAAAAADVTIYREFVRGLAAWTVGWRLAVEAVSIGEERVGWWGKGAGFGRCGGGEECAGEGAGGGVGGFAVVGGDEEGGWGEMKGAGVRESGGEVI